MPRCDPDHSNFSSGLFEWTRLRLVWGTGLLSVTGILLAILAQVGCCRPKPPRYWPHLLRRSLQQVLLRGAICYTIYLCVPWVLLEVPLAALVLAFPFHSVFQLRRCRTSPGALAAFCRT